MKLLTHQGMLIMSTRETTDKEIMGNLAKTVGFFFFATLCMALAVAYFAP